MVTQEHQVERTASAAPIVYIDRSDIRAGKLEDTRAAIRDLVEFVETHVPQLIAYYCYLDENSSRMTVVAIHPDSASLEYHMEAGAPAFRPFMELINLRTIEVYGRPSESVRDQLSQKATLLGENARVVINEPHAGFMRLPPG